MLSLTCSFCVPINCTEENKIIVRGGNVGTSMCMYASIGISVHILECHYGYNGIHKYKCIIQ